MKVVFSTLHQDWLKAAVFKLFGLRILLIYLAYLYQSLTISEIKTETLKNINPLQNNYIFPQKWSEKNGSVVAVLQSLSYLTQ